MSVKKRVPRIALLIASGFGSGFSKYAPGTAGSAAALSVWLLLAYVGLLDSITAQLITVALTTALGVIATAKVLKADPTLQDPQFVVIDEWAGLFVALVGLPHAPTVIGIAFILFRLLDALKPGPVRKLENLPGAIGVMADDIAAGFIASIATHLLLVLAF